MNNNFITNTTESITLNDSLQKSMKDQIKDLPEFEQVERETLRHLSKLNI